MTIHRKLHFGLEVLMQQQVAIVTPVKNLKRLPKGGRHVRLTLYVHGMSFCDSCSS